MSMARRIFSEVAKGARYASIFKGVIAIRYLGRDGKEICQDNALNEWIKKNKLQYHTIEDNRWKICHHSMDDIDPKGKGPKFCVENIVVKVGLLTQDGAAAGILLDMIGHPGDGVHVPSERGNILSKTDVLGAVVDENTPLS